MVSPPPASRLLLGFVVRATGLEMADVCRAAGVPVEASGRAETSYADGLRLWEAVAALTGDPIVGHGLGSRMKLHQVSLFGPILAHAEDLGAGMRNVCGALALAMPQGAVTWTEGDDGFVVRYRRPPADVWSRHGVEMMFATLVALAREATGRAIGVTAVELAAPAPVPPDAFDAFYQVRVRFDAGRDRLVFPRAALTLPMLGREPELARLVVERVPALLAPSRMEERATRACREALEKGEATLAATARRLGTSPRSLQRHLAQEGCTFREVRESATRELATVRLRGSDLSIDAIAESLCFSSRGAFDRAFRRWFGVTPARFRREG